MKEQHRRQRILIVDDTPENLDILINILNNDYQLLVAKNGEKALQVVSSEKPPDLILLDIIMPGMDGYEVCEQVKANEKTKDIPVIFVTGLNEVKDETRGFEAGALDYITKPVSPSVVKARVKTHLELRTSYQRIDLIRTELETEHKEAEKVGKGLLKSKPHNDFLKTALLSAPCSKTCGDRAGFIDEILPITGKKKSWLIVFDSSGHGKGAAKFQEVAIGSLLALLRNGTGMKHALSESNSLLDSLNTGRFIVGNLWRVMEPDEKEVEKGFIWVEEYNLAQHAVITLELDEGVVNEWEWKDSLGAVPPMGLFDDMYADIHSKYRKVKKGTRIVTYTDGITEAMNSAQELYGKERFKEELLKTRNLEPEAAKEKLMQSLMEWISGASEGSFAVEDVRKKMTDDITFIIADITEEK